MRRRLTVFTGIVLLLLIAAGVTAALPRTVAAGTTTATPTWQVRVTPGVLTPRFVVEHDDHAAEAVGQRWPGSLQAQPLTFDDRLTDEPALTAVVGSAPLGTDSVRITTVEQGVREAQVRLAGWHLVHVEVFEGPVTITEVAAIGDGGEVISVLDGDGLG